MSDSRSHNDSDNSDVQLNEESKDEDSNNSHPDEELDLADLADDLEDENHPRLVHDPVLDEPPISPYDDDDGIAGDQGEDVADVDVDADEDADEETIEVNQVFVAYRTLEIQCAKSEKNIKEYEDARTKFDKQYKEANRITRKKREDDIKALKKEYADKFRAIETTYKTNSNKNKEEYVENLDLAKKATGITDLRASKKRLENNRLKKRQAHKLYNEKNQQLHRRRTTMHLRAKKKLSKKLSFMLSPRKSQKEKEKKTPKSRPSLESRASTKSRKSKASTKSRVSVKSNKSSKSQQSRVSFKSIGSMTHDGKVKYATTLEASVADDTSVDIDVDVDVRVKERISSTKKAVGAVVRALSPKNKKRKAESPKDLATCTVPEARAELLRLTGVIVQACDDNGNEMEHSMSFLAKITVAKLDRALATLLGRGINKSSEMRDFWYFRNEATADEWPLKDYYTLCRGSLLLGPLPTRMNAGRKRMHVALMFGFKKDCPCKALDKNKKNQDEWDRFEAERAARAE